MKKRFFQENVLKEITLSSALFQGTGHIHRRDFIFGSISLYEETKSFRITLQAYYYKKTAILIHVAPQQKKKLSMYHQAEEIYFFKEFIGLPSPFRKC